MIDSLFLAAICFSPALLAWGHGRLTRSRTGRELLDHMEDETRA